MSTVGFTGALQRSPGVDAGVCAAYFEEVRLSAKLATSDLTEARDEQAAKHFLTKAIGRHGVPEQITIDGSAGNEADIKSYNQEQSTAIVIRQVKYLNNVVEQDHKAVKRVTRPMLGFKSFDAAQDTLVGIELRHMIKKKQMMVEAGDQSHSAAAWFYSLAA